MSLVLNNLGMSVHFNRSGKEDGKTVKTLQEAACYFFIDDLCSAKKIQVCLGVKDNNRRKTLYFQMGYGKRYRFEPTYFYNS